LTSQLFLGGRQNFLIVETSFHYQKRLSADGKFQLFNSRKLEFLRLVPHLHALLQYFEMFGIRHNPSASGDLR